MTDLKPLERQIRILQQFTLKSEITVDWLYEYFDRAVSKRTLQRDLLALSAANVPLNEKRGAHGQIFWSLNPNYLKFIPMTLGMDEFISSLLLKRMAGIFKNTPIEKDINNLDKKLKQLITDDVLSTSEGLQDLESYFSPLNIGYIDYSNYGQQLQKYLFAAINQRQSIVKYKSATTEQTKQYIIYPYSLLLNRGTFYGVVYHPKHKKYINLLIHRIQQIEVLGDTFERDSVFNLKNYMLGTFGVWHDEPQLVRIKFAPKMVSRISERVWQIDQIINAQKDGSIILTMNVVISQELVAWILRWGGFAEALSPTRLVDLVKEEVNILHKIYNQN